MVLLGFQFFPQKELGEERVSEVLLSVTSGNILTSEPLDVTMQTGQGEGCKLTCHVSSV